MTIDLRIIAVAVLVACKGAQDARAKTPAPTTESAAAAAASALPATPAATSPDPLLARADSGRIRGSASSKVWLIIASDFQCPYCKMWHDSTDAAIRKEYVDNGKVRLAFVNFPLNIHPNAVPAAEYAMCAAAQDKFWSMHDALFAQQDKWAPLENPTAALEQVATSAGVDLPALESCVSAHKMRPLIEADHEKAARAGVRATPSFFIGNQVLEGVQPASELRKALDAALAAAGTQR